MSRQGQHASSKPDINLLEQPFTSSYGPHRARQNSRNMHESDKHKGRIVLAFTTPFFPVTRGDASRNSALVGMLTRDGWFVTVILLVRAGQGIRRAAKAVMESLCDDLLIYRTQKGIPEQSIMTCDGWCPDGFADFVAAVCLRQKAFALIVQHVMLSKCLSAVARRDPHILKIVDTHDIFAERRTVFVGAGVEYRGFTTSVQEEAKALSRADLVIAQQEADLEYFQQHLSESFPVVLIPHPAVTRPLPRAYQKNVLFVGDANDVNIKGLRGFMSGVFPVLTRRYPDVRLVLAGTVGSAFVCSDRVICLGPVPELTAVYASAGIVVNTEPCGTGLKIKTAEALLFGRALLTTPAGAQGLEDYKGIYRVAHDWHQFAWESLSLLRDLEVANDLGDRALHFASRYFDPRVLSNRLNAAMIQARGALVNGLNIQSSSGSSRRTIKVVNPCSISLPSS